MKLQKHVYEWDRVVIGGDLRSLLFAATHDYPVIFTSPNPPFRFNTITPHPSLSNFGFTEKGLVSELELWEKMFFILGLSGLCPLSSRARSIRVKENTLIITTENLRVVKATFNKLIVFEDTHLQGLPEVVREEHANNVVFDWFDVRYGCRHKLNAIKGADQFISRIHFYPTGRSDNKSLKDAVSVSHLSNEQLKNLDFSEYMARFKVEHIMKEAGIKGPINGYRNKKPIFLNIKLEHAERQVVPMGKRIYKRDRRYEFRYDTIEDLLHKINLFGYAKKLAGFL